MRDSSPQLDPRVHWDHALQTILQAWMWGSFNLLGTMQDDIYVSIWMTYAVGCLTLGCIEDNPLRSGNADIEI